jgi:hypothetical protein
MLPVALISGHGQFGLRFESIIETALVNLCLFADVIDADGTIAALPDHRDSGFEELSFGFAFRSHKTTLVD